MKFTDKLEKSIKNSNSLLCVGLDTDISKIPKHLLKTRDPVFEFNKAIIDSTSDLVSSYKLQIAYYEVKGFESLKSLKKTVDYLVKNYPSTPIICDAKRGDIGSTSKQYAISLFDYYNFDAVTVNPYLGFDALEPFLEYKNKGVIVLCRTSNPSASDFQNLLVKHQRISPDVSYLGHFGSETDMRHREKPLYIKVAEKVVEWNKKYKNCLMVVGSTWPKEMKTIRKIAPEMFFLVPGTGAQGGDLKKTLENGLRSDKSGLIIHSARAIIYAASGKDFAETARQKAKVLKNEINKYRK